VGIVLCRLWNVGFFDFGKNTKAPDEADFTFIKINKMWNEPIDAGLNSVDEEMDSNESETSIGGRPKRSRRQEVQWKRLKSKTDTETILEAEEKEAEGKLTLTDKAAAKGRRDNRKRKAITTENKTNKNLGFVRQFN
jgi:hypothetical protein